MTGPPVAQRFFDAQREYLAREGEVETELILAFGYSKMSTLPFERIVFDYYDASFELKGTQVGFAPTPEQLEACWALGFLRCWICYVDGSERYHYKA